ncbi:MAG: DUF4352 domain-containing protein [Alicyclobacillus sp.]|nr:DUF4352 domain-containing protein [Alicyclobacillus sp.]
MSADRAKKSIFKRWWFWVAVVVIIIVVASVSSGGNGNKSTAAAPATSNAVSSAPTSAPSHNTSTSTSAAYKVGQTATVDKLQVRVNSVKYESKINDGGMGIVQQNGGVWLIVNVTVKNNDTTARTLDDSLFTVLHGDTKYSASTSADIYINNNQGFFLSQVNPGLSETGNIAFNVPAKAAYQLQVNSGFLAKTSAVFDLTN